MPLQSCQVHREVMLRWPRCSSKDVRFASPLQSAELKVDRDVVPAAVQQDEA